MNFFKKIFSIVVIALLLTGCKETPKETANAEKEVPSPETISAHFNIEGMSCAVMCATKIEKELNELNGIVSAKVDFDSKIAIVEYDSKKQSLESIKKTIESISGGNLYKVSAMSINSQDHTFSTKEREENTCCSNDTKKVCSVKKEKTCHSM